MTKEVFIYGTDTCPTCISNKPDVLNLIKENGLTAVIVNADEVPLEQLIEEGVKSVPTYIIKENGKTLHTIRGSLKAFKDIVEEL